MNQQQRIALFSRLQMLNPYPTTELYYNTPFELLIAVMLSAQTTDVRVNLVTAQLFAIANTPQQILQLGISGLKSYIRSIGLYNTKAKHLLQTCTRLITHHSGKVPADRTALEALPGVGRKTANVVLNTAFGWPTIAVDTHIFRVCNRTGIAPGKTPLQVERQLLAVVPNPFKQHCHHWLVLHGRYICLARKPCCGRCPITTWCEFQAKQFQCIEKVTGTG